MQSKTNPKCITNTQFKELSPPKYSNPKMDELYNLDETYPKLK